MQRAITCTSRTFWAVSDTGKLGAPSPTLGRPPAQPGACLTTSAATRLPTYTLYGEPGRGQAIEPLHCERIAERSQRHDWEIAPHRHEALIQILHIQRGTADWCWRPSATWPTPRWRSSRLPTGWKIADGLDFTDAGYFTRFFQRQTGHTPSAWRALTAR